MDESSGVPTSTGYITFNILDGNIVYMKREFPFRGLVMVTAGFLVVGVILLAGSCALSTLFPANPKITLTPAAALQPTIPPSGKPPKAILYENRQLAVEWPSILRVGDGALLRLSLTVDNEGKITPTVIIQDNQITGEPVQIPNLYDTHHILAEARLDIAGLQVAPQGSVQEPMLPGQPLTFYWSLNAPSPGNYRGTLWLFLELIPKNGGQIERLPLLARQIDLEARSFLGLPVNVARWAGFVGAVAGVVLGFPFIQTLIMRLWKKTSRKRGDGAGKAPTIHTN
jgi:hypothetical protein